MCGIFGAFRKGGMPLGVNQRKFLADASIAGAVRGVDSLGFIMGERKEAKKGTNITFYKKAENGTTVVDGMFNPRNDMHATTHFCVGHNRAATAGSVTDDNAHPFIEGSIIGVHNGTLRGDWKKRLQVSRKLDVDSRGLYRAVNTRGCDWAIKNAGGAMALVWVDLDSSTPYIYRNTERSLFYLTTECNTLLIASEAGMLYWLAHRNGMKWKDAAESFKAKTLYRIDGCEVVELRTLTETEEYDSHSSYYGGWSRVSDGKNWPSQQKDKTHTKPKSSITPKAEGNTSGKSDTPDTTDDPGRQCIDHGIRHYGRDVPESDRRNNIVGEFVERSTTTYLCQCCKKAIEGSFLEDADNQMHKIHIGCLPVEQQRGEDVGRTWIRLLRKCGMKEKAA